MIERHKHPSMRDKEAERARAEERPAPEDKPAAPEERPEAEAAAEAEAEAPKAGAVADAETLAAEVAELKVQLLRALAETENVRRRAAAEREQVAAYAITGFARDVLPVVDNLRRALDSVPAEARGDEALARLIEGVEMTEREFLAALDKHGIRRLDPLGEKFDHNYHQAVFEVEDSDRPEGTVAQVLQVGYTIHDRLLRPAMVGVVKGKAEAARGVDTTA